MIVQRALSVVLVAAVTAPALEAQSMRTVTMSRQLEDREEVRVEVDYGAGGFSVRSIDEGVLYRMNLRYDEDRFEPVAEYANHHLQLGVESIDRRSGGRHESGELVLELARGVPMRLDLDFGAVRADLDLGGLALTHLDVSTGASESVVDVSEPNTQAMERAEFEVGAAEFEVHRLGNLNAERIVVDAGVGSITLGLDGEWTRDASLSIDMGLGALELRVPEGLGIRLTKDSFLTSLDSEGLVRRGDVYESVDWGDAAHNITIDLDAAFGSVKVVWIR